LTRINCVPVSELVNKHLLAEWREMPRLVGNLTKSLNSKKGFKLQDVPATYRMGKGHVQFFYDKFKWLHERHKQLTAELLSRGYNLHRTDSNIFQTVADEYYGDWQPNDDDMSINRLRIAERLGEVK
jgi:deoxyribonuclease (pyrimidine dimer)